MSERDDAEVGRSVDEEIRGVMGIIHYRNSELFTLVNKECAVSKVLPGYVLHRLKRIMEKHGSVSGDRPEDIGKNVEEAMRSMHREVDDLISDLEYLTGDVM